MPNIIITESIANELKDMFAMTQFKFKSNVKKFLAGLLEDPIGTDVDNIFKFNGIDKNKLINILVDNHAITKKFNIDDHDADGNPHTAKMIVKYSVPKENFNEKLDSIYELLFPDSCIINEECGGAASCCGVDGSGFGSGEFVQPLFGGNNHKASKNKKRKVGGDPYIQNLCESLDEYGDSLINTDDVTVLPSFAKQVAYCKEKLGSPIGNGSSRIVFRVDDNKVLKLAKNKKGIAQNEAECENCNDYYMGDMFAQVFEYDKNNYTYIVAEEALPPKAADFKVCLGVSYKEFCRICLGAEAEYSRTKYNTWKLKQEDYDMLEENEELRQWYNYITNYQPTSVYELIRKCNLGLAKNRKDCPNGLKIIITDSGFNDDVKQLYYGKVNESITGKDIEKAAALYVYNEDKDHNWYILCAKRANRKGDEEGGKWNPPMGHLHKGESIKDGAIRECKEESGIDFSKYKSEISVKDHHDWGSNCVLKLGLFTDPNVTIDDFKPGKGDEENEQFIWLPIEEVNSKEWAWSCGENIFKFLPREIDLSESKKRLSINEERGEDKEDDFLDPQVIEIDGEYNYRKPDGQLLVPDMRFDYCGKFNYGVGVIQNGKRWNFIDRDGNLLSPYKWFERCYKFHDGVGRVENNYKDAFMNKYGDFIISRWFEDSRGFKDGYGKVFINGNWKFIDTKGNIYTSKPIRQNNRKNG